MKGCAGDVVKSVGGDGSEFLTFCMRRKGPDGDPENHGLGQQTGGRGMLHYCVKQNGSQAAALLPRWETSKFNMSEGSAEVYNDSRCGDSTKVCTRSSSVDISARECVWGSKGSSTVSDMSGFTKAINDNSVRDTGNIVLSGGFFMSDPWEVPLIPFQRSRAKKAMTLLLLNEFNVCRRRVQGSTKTNAKSLSWLTGTSSMQDR